MSKAPNQTLIARQLNLAPGTVSRALRQQPGIKSETRERVLKLAQKLGYTVRLRGQAAADAEACYLGVLVQSPESSWTHTRYLVGLSQAAAAIQRLRHSVANPDEPRQNILFDVEFVPGDSTGPIV